MSIIFYLLFLFFVLGTLMGSFLNCVIYRLKKGKSFISGRSFCPKCKHNLEWYDLIPIFSFIALRGKCRYCKKRISLQYPLVEVATGIIFVLIFWHLGFGFDLIFGLLILDFIYLLTVCCLLIIIFVYDLRYYIIPDKIIYLAIFIVFFYHLFRILNFGHWNLFGIWDLGFGIWKPLLEPLITGIGAGAFFFLLWFVSSGRWLGFGDVKLTFLMGFFLGFPNIIAALFSTYLIGAIIGIGLIVFKKKSLKSKIPFGPFLVLGTFIALFWGERIINWYLNFL